MKISIVLILLLSLAFDFLNLRTISKKSRKYPAYYLGFILNIPLFSLFILSLFWESARYILWGYGMFWAKYAWDIYQQKSFFKSELDRQFQDDFAKDMKYFRTTIFKIHHNLPFK